MAYVFKELQVPSPRMPWGKDVIHYESPGMFISQDSALEATARPAGSRKKLDGVSSALLSRQENDKRGTKMHPLASAPGHEILNFRQAAELLREGRPIPGACRATSEKL